MSDSEDEFLTYENKPSHEEVMKELDELQNHPLFATNEIQLAQNSEENEALRSLLYDEDKEVLAQNFYIQANNILNNKVLSKQAKDDEIKYYLKQAEKKYDEAISQNSDDKNLQSKLYCNFALVHFKLKNYGRCSELCDKAIKLNSNYIKAFYRKAQCQFELKKYKQCIEVCEEALQIEKEAAIINLKKRAKKLYNKELQKEKDKQIIKNLKLGKTIEYLNKQNILYSVTPTLQLPEIYKREFNLIDNKIQSSIVFLYPEFGQFDFIQTSQEEHLLWDYFKHVFNQGLPWDTNNVYKLYQLELYVELNSQKPINNFNYEIQQKKLRKIPKKSTIMQIMKFKDYIVPQCLEIIVVSAASEYYKFFLDKYKSQLILHNLNLLMKIKYVKENCLSGILKEVEQHLNLKDNQDQQKYDIETLKKEHEEYIEIIRIINEKLAIKFEKITNDLSMRKQNKDFDIQKILNANNSLENTYQQNLKYLQKEHTKLEEELQNFSELKIRENKQKRLQELQNEKIQFEKSIEQNEKLIKLKEKQNKNKKQKYNLEYNQQRNEIKILSNNIQKQIKKIERLKLQNQKNKDKLQQQEEDLKNFTQKISVDKIDQKIPLWQKFNILQQKYKILKQTFAQSQKVLERKKNNYKKTLQNKQKLIQILITEKENLTSQCLQQLIKLINVQHNSKNS